MPLLPDCLHKAFRTARALTKKLPAHSPFPREHLETGSCIVFCIRIKAKLILPDVVMAEQLSFSASYWFSEQSGETSATSGCMGENGIS